MNITVIDNTYADLSRLMLVYNDHNTTNIKIYTQRCPIVAFRVLAKSNCKCCNNYTHRLIQNHSFLLHSDISPPQPTRQFQK